MSSDSDIEQTISKMNRGFYPRNIAVIGAARHNQHRWLKAHLPFHQNHGTVFNVNINEDEWLGASELNIKSFKSILDIEDPIDYVTISVPRRIVPNLIRECVEKQVAVAHIYSAGFDESGEEEGILLHHEIQQLANEAGLLIIGPNCMGLFNPSVGIRQSEAQYYGEQGHFGYISQSGSMAIGMVMEANSENLKMSKCISMGNGMVLDVADYLEYLRADINTKIIGMYIEGVRNPQGFFKSLRRTTMTKPVVVWKVGQTEDSARATQAHTGTSYIREEIWNSLISRCGAIAAESQEQMIALSRSLSLMDHSTGYNVGLYASSGGHSTDMANVFSQNGFKVVPLTDSSNKQLASFLDLIGRNFVNPIQQAPQEHFERIVNILCQDGNTDIVILELPRNRFVNNDELIDERIAIIKRTQMNTTKPIAVVLSPGHPRQSPQFEEILNKKLSDNNILAFPNFTLAATVLRKLTDYHISESYLQQCE